MQLEEASKKRTASELESEPEPTYTVFDALVHRHEAMESMHSDPSFLLPEAMLGDGIRAASVPEDEAEQKEDDLLPLAEDDAEQKAESEYTDLHFNVIEVDDGDGEPAQVVENYTVGDADPELYSADGYSVAEVNAFIIARLQAMGIDGPEIVYEESSVSSE